MTHFGPPDATLAPRYTGVRTFARLPHVELPRDDVDAAVIGVPFDTATSFRSGARFGPEARALRRFAHVLCDGRVPAVLSGSGDVPSLQHGPRARAIDETRASLPQYLVDDAGSSPIPSAPAVG